MVDQAKERLGHRCTLRKAVAEDLPFDDNEFDYVFLINTLEFLDNPIEALREAGRVAHRIVFVGVLNSFSWQGIMSKIHGILGNPIFRHAHLYNLWELKSLLKSALGPVPLSWASLKKPNSFFESVSPSVNQIWKEKQSPFGCFLGVAASMHYQFRADTMPIKAKIKKPRQSLVDAKTFEGAKQGTGVMEHERGLSL
jgi:SAM-dependent methyltransferase